MGIYCSEDRNPQKIFNLEHKEYKPNELELLNSQLKKFDEAIESNVKFDQDSYLDSVMKDSFIEKYGLYINIKRFAIPIIGVINSGKSTFMNKILNLNDVLQTNNVVTTRFITIIRHDKNAEIPEVYQVKIERRNKNDGFNFIEKGENLLKSKGKYTSIQKIIKELNEDIEKSNSQNSQKYLKDIDKYFLIIRTKIPLFEGKYEEYGNLIDFLDIPGLDENKSGIYSEESVFNDFIPMIFSNILFPIFIFDIKSFATGNPMEVFKSFFDLYVDKTRKTNTTFENEIIPYPKGIYIMNKMDLIDNDNSDAIFKGFIKKFEKMKISYYKFINISLKKDDNFFGIVATQLFKQKTGSFIEDEFDNIIIESKNSQKNSFKSFIKEYLKKYQIDLNKAKEEKEDPSLKERLDILNNKLKKECQSFNNPKFDLKEFTYLSKFGNSQNEGGKNNDKILLLKIKEEIKKEIDLLLDFNFGSLISIIDSELENKKKSMIAKKGAYDIDFLLNFNKKVLSLFPEDLREKYKNFKEIENEVNNFSNFYNNKTIRILFIGIISSGKTSLLNSIIGHNYNILQTTHSECTKCIYRIKYSKNISFCESKLCPDKKYGKYFEDIDGTQIYDKEEIIKKISISNSNEKKSLKYYTLYVPIEGLESIENKENIELIDLPGITKDNVFDYDLRSLFYISDGFIFTFNSLSIDDANSNFIFDRIIEYIKNRMDGFDFKNCLFHLNFIDEIQDNLIPQKTKEFKEMIKKKINDKIYIGNFVEKMALNDNILSSDDINLSYLSNKFYEIYQKNVQEIQFLEFINDDKLKDIYENYILEEYDENGRIEKMISRERFNKKELEEKMQLIRQKSSDNDEIYILKIAKFLIIFDKHKKKLIKKYDSSKAELFFKQFNNQIKISDKNSKMILNQKFYTYIVTLLYDLFYYYELCIDEKKNDYYKSKIKVKKQTIENEYKKIENIIDNNLNETKKEIDILKEKVIKIAEQKEKLTVKEIKEMMKELDIEEKLNKLFNYLYEDLKKINFNFTYFCINEISTLLDSKEFRNIVSNINEKFRDIDNSSFGKAAMYSIGVTLVSSLLTYSSSLTFFAVLGFLGTAISILVFVEIITLSAYFWLRDNNTQKVKDYFEKVTKELDDKVENFKKSIKEKKDEFIKKLGQKNEIASKEIIALKISNYTLNFEEIKKLFK